MPTREEILKRFQFPRGPESNGSPYGGLLSVTDGVATPTHPIHRVAADEEIATITPPTEGFVGFIYLYTTGEDTFTLVTGGNIQALELIVNNGFVTQLLFVPEENMWFPLGAFPSVTEPE